MRCSKFRKNMFLYLENKLSSNDEQKMTEHLKTCAWCNAEFKKTKKIMTVMNDTKPKMVPENLHKNIMVEVNGMRSFNEEEKRENKIAFRVAIKRAGVAFAAMFIVICMLEFVDFGAIKKGDFRNVLKVDKMEVKTSDTAEYSTLKMAALEDKTESASTGEVTNESKEEESDGYKGIKEESLFELFSFGNASNKTAELAGNGEKQNTNDVNLTTLDIADLASNENEEARETLSRKDEIAGIKKEKGFLTDENYSEMLDDADITKKSMIELYVSDFEGSLEKISNKATECGGVIYYQNIEYNYEDDDKFNDDATKYRNAVVAIKVLESNYKTLKSEVEKLGTYDINVEQKENVIAGENYEELLDECKKEKETLEKKLESLKEDYNDIEEPSDEEKEKYNEEKEKIENDLESTNVSITNLEETIASENERMKEEAVKLEVTLRECDELDIEGILSGKVFGHSIKKAFGNGVSSFVRAMQNAFLWVCENILFIILFVILFGLVFALLKYFLLRNDD